MLLSAIGPAGWVLRVWRAFGDGTGARVALVFKLPPSQFPIAMYDAFVEELNKAGVRDTRSRVFASQIPVRT